jgi:phosphopantothenoylcysteine decarboxylase/phosphopantothenate--cysteine ligase
MNADIEHIALTTEAKLLLVVPATAQVIAKFAHGIADDFLSSFHLAFRAPILMAPAMNTNMLEHPAVQANLATLTSRGVRFVEPGAGYLACGWIGKGRLAEPEDIVEAAHQLLMQPLPGSGALANTRLLVTAGPTYEDLDPVRYIGNRSSGRMGLAIAAEARQRGADVTVVLGPSKEPAPDGVRVVPVRSAADMRQAVLNELPHADAVIMAAAVADYTPSAGAEAQKIAKGEGGMTLTLVRTQDILAELGRTRGGAARPVLVGFAAETSDVIAKAQAKLARKDVDLIVANDVSRRDAGFDVETNAGAFVSRDGVEDVPLQSKREMAGRILDRVQTLLQASAAVPR